MKKLLSSAPLAVMIGLALILTGLTSRSAAASAPAARAASIAAAADGSPAGAIIGLHIVKRGETLYCIGRAYAVRPSAIAQANRIVAPYLVFPGQVLVIPDAPWGFIPAGPVCVPQFRSPFLLTLLFNGLPTLAPTSAATATPAPTRTPVCNPPEYFDPLLNRCWLDPNRPVIETPTPFPFVVMPPTSTPRPCLPPEFYDPFLNRCRLPDPSPEP